MKAIRLAMLAAASLAAAPAQAADFLVQIGSPVGTANCGGADTGISNTPVVRDVACSLSGIPGNLDARAASLLGHVGGSSGANVSGGYFGSSFGIGTTSQFSDFVTFTSTTGATSALIAANLAFSGTLNSTAFANSSVDLFYHLEGGSGFHFFSASKNGVSNPHFTIAQGSVSSTVSNAILRTAMFTVPMDVPMRMTLRLSTGAGVGGSGSPESSRAEFSNSFEVPLGMDAFLLPDGVTANAGSWLVNNRRVGAATGAVPEPSAWLMLILGFGLVGAALRQRAVALAA